MSNKKRRSLVNRFEFYTKRNGIVVIRHKLAKKDKTTYAYDKYCKTQDANELTSQLNLMDKRYKEEYKTLTPQERRYKRVLLRIVRDNRDYKLTFDTSTEESVLLDNIDMDNGVIEATNNISNKRVIYTTDFNEEESCVLIRDNEGNITELYGNDIEETEITETKQKSNKEKYKDYTY